MSPDPNEAKDDTYSVGDSSSSFGNSSIFGIILNGVTLIDNCLKIVKGGEIEYRDRIVQLSKAKAREKQEEESQKKKQTQENKTWLPEILQRRQEIKEMVAKLKALVDKDVNEEHEEIVTLAKNCEQFLIMLNRKYFDLEIKRLVSDQLSAEDSSSSETSFLNELKQIEEKFKYYGQKLHDLLSENEHCNIVMTLWEKVSISPPLYKIEALEECLRFFNSGIEEQTSFTQEEATQFKNTLSDLGEELASAKDRLTNTIKLTLDGRQKEYVEYDDMQALKDKINELDNHSLEPRLSRSSLTPCAT